MSPRVLLFASFVLGCGGATAPSAAAPGVRAADRAALQLLPADATFVFVVRSAELLGSPAAQAVLSSVASPALFAQLTERYGIDLREVGEIAGAVYDSSTLVVLQGGFSPEAARDRIRRMLVAPLRQTEHSVGGMLVEAGPNMSIDVAIGGRQTLIVCVSEGEAGQTLIGEAARRASQGGASVADRPFVRDLLDAVGAAPLRAALLTPPRNLPQTGAGQLLSGVQSIVLGVAPRADAGADDPGFQIVTILRGDLPPTAVANFRNLIQSVARQPLAEAFGLGEAARRAEVGSPAPGSVRIELTVSARRLATGAQLFLGDPFRALLPPAGAPNGSGTNRP